MPSLTTVTLYKKIAFRKKKTVHTKSPSSSSPSFLDITPALSHYLSFPLSFTLNNTIITPLSIEESKQHTKISNKHQYDTKEKHNYFIPITSGFSSHTGSSVRLPYTMLSFLSNTGINHLYCPCLKATEKLE